MLSILESKSTHSSRAIVDQPDQVNSNSLTTWRKVGILAPFILAGAALLYIKIMSKKPCIPQRHQDPDYPQFCDLAKTSWESFKKSVVNCPMDECPNLAGYNKNDQYVCLDEIQPALNQYVSYCKIDPKAIESEISLNTANFQPLTGDNRYTSLEKKYFSTLDFTGLISYLRGANCHAENCCDLDESELHPREIEALEAIYRNRFFKPQFEESQECLRLRADDPRPKALFISTNHVVGRLESSPPSSYVDVSLPGAVDLRTLNKETDLKYKVLINYREICREVNIASKIGNISSIYIQADRASLLRFAERHGYLIPDKNNPFFECYASAYSGKKIKPVWLG